VEFAMYRCKFGLVKVKVQNENFTYTLICFTDAMCQISLERACSANAI